MKIGTIFKYLIYFICVILFSCKKTEIRENAKEDVDEAIKYTQGIYKIVSEEKWDSLNGFISERFKLENGRQIFSQINNLVGKIIETKIKNVKTTYSLIKRV